MWIRRDEFEKLVKRVHKLEHTLSDVAVPTTKTYEACDPDYNMRLVRNEVKFPFRDVLHQLILAAKLKATPPCDEKARLL